MVFFDYYGEKINYLPLGLQRQTMVKFSVYHGLEGIIPILIGQNFNVINNY